MRLGGKRVIKAEAEAATVEVFASTSAVINRGVEGQEQEQGQGQGQGKGKEKSRGRGRGRSRSRGRGRGRGRRKAEAGAGQQATNCISLPAAIYFSAK